jgi:hypothetical protein
MIHLLEFHIAYVPRAFFLARSLMLGGTASAAIEFHLQVDFGFGSFGIVVLLFSFLLSTGVSLFVAFLACWSRIAKRLMPVLIVPFYLLDSYLMYVRMCSRYWHPATAYDFLTLQIIFLIAAGWLYLLAWFVYRSNKLDPLFEKPSDSNSLAER